MSKIAQYLQEHIQGEVTTHPTVLTAMSTDASVLRIMPEMVIYPRTTNDIRKVARFAWQLAEKGHTMALTARGGGSDQTGAALGKGAILALSAHMNQIFEFDSRQKLIRVQPGVSAQVVDDALRLQGMSIQALPLSAPYSTIGGAIANNASGPLSGRYGDMSDWVHQLEVVLANGDVLQTQRLNKRELNKKKGLQTLEGEIYRSLDNLIQDNAELIEAKLGGDSRDNVGYNSLARVKRSDGSFDLTPLFVGSQGTLGIVSEIILNAEFAGAEQAVAALAFSNREAARDAIDQLLLTKPAIFEYFDGELFTVASDRGRSYDVCKALDGPVGAVLLIGFDEFNEGMRSRKLKRVAKIAKAVDCQIVSANGAGAAAILAMRQVTAYTITPAAKGMSAPSLFDGVYVPSERFEDFQSAVAELAKKHLVTLALHSRVLENIYYARPNLQLSKVGDKQKIFKLLNEYSVIVTAHGGHLVAESGEGRMKAGFAYEGLGDGVLALFRGVKDIFDPSGIMNPGVKQPQELRQLVADLGADREIAPFAQYNFYR